MMELKVPDLGEDTEDPEVLEVLVSPGDSVEPNQRAFELESDTAAFELPCPHALHRRSDGFTDGSALSFIATMERSASGGSTCYEVSMNCEAIL